MISSVYKGVFSQIPSHSRLSLLVSGNISVGIHHSGKETEVLCIQKKNWNFFKETFPHSCPWDFWQCGGRKLLSGLCPEVEYQVTSGADRGPKST